MQTKQKRGSLHPPPPPRSQETQRRKGDPLAPPHHDILSREGGIPRKCWQQSVADQQHPCAFGEIHPDRSHLPKGGDLLRPPIHSGGRERSLPRCCCWMRGGIGSGRRKKTTHNPTSCYTHPGFPPRRKWPRVSKGGVGESGRKRG